MMALTSAPIPGCAGGAIGADMELVEALAAGVVAVLAVAAAVEPLVSVAVGRLHVTQLANGFTDAAAGAAVPALVLVELGSDELFATRLANRLAVSVFPSDAADPCRTALDCTGI
jgi:hypothetical protein